ncbi:MAG: hypothetical protein KA004_05000 [Verrucomicrobiales bacterium]|nr:hypothetical protein [Verrucomicrobiales bacterium]
MLAARGAPLDLSGEWFDVPLGRGQSLPIRRSARIIAVMLRHHIILSVFLASLGMVQAPPEPKVPASLTPQPSENFRTLRDDPFSLDALTRGLDSQEQRRLKASEFPATEFGGADLLQALFVRVNRFSPDSEQS